MEDTTEQKKKPDSSVLLETEVATRDDLKEVVSIMWMDFDTLQFNGKAMKIRISAGSDISS